jgi:hypothetical protein
MTSIRMLLLFLENVTFTPPPPGDKIRITDDSDIRITDDDIEREID